MAAPNLDKMNVKELNELIEAAQAMIAKKDKEERKRALQEARDAASKRGYKLEDLFGGEAKPSVRGGVKRKLKPKFRHPENPDLTWSGVGRRPKWVVEAEQAGNLDSVRIDD